MSGKAITKIDICDEIKKGEEVDIVPEYEYLFGERVKDYFDVKPGEIVIKKIDNAKKRPVTYTIIKCLRKDLELKKFDLTV